ncbi:ABC transporter permease [Candidatus Saccharibacteria bacterium]|nr:ABC transporter permease [Candidatus Saccharibacteria bacterium]
MNSFTFKVAKFEIMRQLKKPAFWAATLLIPLLMGGIYFISFISSQNVDQNPALDENTKVAITDDAGVFSNQAPFIINGDKEYGKEMVTKGEVDLYFYIPKDFLETKKAEFYHISEGLEMFNFDANILKSLMAQDAATRVAPSDILALNGQFEIEDNKLAKDGSNSNALGKAIIPFFIGILFFMFICLCGNRFLLCVVEEKENRISEMILTAVSPKHLIVGKIIAMLVLGMIQILAITIPVVLLVFANRDNQMISQILAMIEVDPVAITLSILLFIVSSIFYAGACTFVGSLVSTAKDASSFIGPAIIAMVLPLYCMQMFMMTEPNFVVQFFTYFPLSAPVALMLRQGFGTITTLEYCIGLAVVFVAAVVMIRLAVVTFQKNAINFGTVSLKIGRRKK